MTEEKKKPAGKAAPQGEPPAGAPKPPKGEAPAQAAEAPKAEAAKQEAPKAEAAETKAAPAKTKRAAVAKEDRKFVNASTGQQIDHPTEMGHAAGTQANVDLNAEHAAHKGQAQPFRIAAIVLWVLGIVAEVLCFVFLKGNKSMPWIITPLVVDLVLVVVGSQLWKKANHIDPPAKAEGFMYWLKTELGLVVAVIAFFPIVILLLLDKNSDGKTKGIATAVAVVALVIAGASGIDYHPATQEGLDAAATQASLLSDDGMCYWTDGGSVYHFNPDCQALSHSATINQGTVNQAFDAGKTRGCKFCTEATGEDVIDSAKSDSNIIQMAQENQDSTNLETATPEDAPDEVKKAA